MVYFRLQRKSSAERVWRFGRDLERNDLISSEENSSGLLSTFSRKNQTHLQNDRMPFYGIYGNLRVNGNPATHHLNSATMPPFPSLPSLTSQTKTTSGMAAGSRPWW
jgi:hypothetical protein